MENVEDDGYALMDTADSYVESSGMMTVTTIPGDDDSAGGDDDDDSALPLLVTNVEDVAAAWGVELAVIKAKSEPMVSLQVAEGAMRKQQVQVERTGVKMTGLDEGVEDLGALIRASRFARLDTYAQKYHWKTEAPSQWLTEHPEKLEWWKEWVDLKPEADALALTRAAGEVPGD